MPEQSLIIVESPTKARTIGRFLGSQFEVASSYGHVRDLPKSKLGVDVAHDFAPQYVQSPRAKKAINELKTKAKNAAVVRFGSAQPFYFSIFFHILDFAGEKFNNIIVVSRE